MMVDDDMEEDPFEEEMKPVVQQEAIVKKEIVDVKTEPKPVGELSLFPNFLLFFSFLCRPYLFSFCFSFVLSF